MRIGPKDKGLDSRDWIPSRLWNHILKSIPLACLDMIIQRDDDAILFGYRIISPYKRVWAAPGGRMLRGESVVQAARRVSKEYGLGFCELYLIGVFPIKSRFRSDVAIAVAARDISGQPLADGKEFSSMKWFKILPRTLGANYRRMTIKWLAACRSRDFLALNRLDEE